MPEHFLSTKISPITALDKLLFTGEACYQPYANGGLTEERAWNAMNVEGMENWLKKRKEYSKIIAI